MMKLTIQKVTTLSLAMLAPAALLQAQVAQDQQGFGQEQPAIQLQQPQEEAEAEEEKDVLAKVNGDAITQAELDATLKMQLEGRQVEPAVVQKLRVDTLNSLIESRLVEQYVLEEGPKVESEEVESIIDGAKQQLQAQGVRFDQFLAERGHTEESFEKRIEGSLAWQKYQQQELTEDKLQQHFLTNKERFPVQSYEEARPLVAQSFATKMWSDIVQAVRDDAEIEKVKPEAFRLPREPAIPGRQPNNGQGGDASPVLPRP